MKIDAKTGLTGAVRLSSGVWKIGEVGDIAVRETETGHEGWWVDINDDTRVVRFRASSRKDFDDAVVFYDEDQQAVAEFRSLNSPDPDPNVDPYVARMAIEKWRSQVIGTTNYADFLAAEGVGDSTD